jgi:hypothetical protein
MWKIFVKNKIRFSYIVCKIYMTKMKKTPINCKPKCCENIEWGIGYVIGETVNLLVNMCIHFVNNANKGYDRSNDKKKKYR